MHMEKVSFQIEKIYAGWFDVSFITLTRKCYITASDAWCNNSPKHFLQMLVDLLDGRDIVGYVVFDEEPGTYIVYIESGEVNKLIVSYSKMCNHDWGNVELHGKLSQRELAKAIAIDREMLSVEDFDLNEFATTVVEAFEKYASKHGRDKYEGNWMDFPMEELVNLKKSL